MPDSTTSQGPATSPGEGPPASGAHAICVYAEPKVRGRRVVVVGDASLGLGERLLDLGARTVHLYDPDPARAGAASAPRGLTVRPLPDGDFDVRDGAFDVAIVPDLGEADARGDLLARVRRLLARGGAAIVGGGGGTSGRGVDYYELYDRVALQFSSVRMVAEMPFAGVALADLGLEGTAPEVTVDTQLAGEPGAPERFFALAGDAEVRLADYAIVQLPAAPPPEVVAAPPARPDPSHAILAEAQLRATLLEAQIDELRAKVAQRAAVPDLTDRVGHLEAALKESRARVADAEARAAEHYQRAERFSHEARQVEGELSRERDRANALEGALQGAEAVMRSLRATGAGAEEKLAVREADLADVLAALAAAQESARAGEARLARAAAAELEAAALLADVATVSEEHASELGQLEESLRERARAVRELEHEVSRRERIVRELLATLEEARSTTEGPAPEGAGAARDAELASLEVATLKRDLAARDEVLRAVTERARVMNGETEALRAKLDAASMELARRTSEREELAWRIAELEQAVQRLEAEQTELTVTIPPPPMARAASASGADSRRLGDLQDELDILRQAMAQEHAARVRAESGEELEKARSELARQAILLEQLSRELDAKDRARDGGGPGRSVDRTEA